MSSALPAALFGDGFTPHGFCLAWQPGLLAVHIASDAIIALSYYSIPLALAALLIRRRDIAFGWAMWLFGSFILACGTTHVLDIWTLWHADYAMQGLLKAFTAAVSLCTAILLWPLVPKLVALPSPADLTRANDALSQQIREKELALDALKREIAERERAEAMLLQSQKMQAIGQLTGGIAHDFNNLLMVVQGNLDVLGAHLRTDGRVQRYIAQSMDAVNRASQLTQRLLAFARRQPLRPERLDVNRRIMELRELLLTSINRVIRLDLRLPDGLWPVEADSNQLDNALLNLAINASHAMPEGGEITLETDNVALTAEQAARLPGIAAGEFVRLRVRDTGTGMDAATREKAFEPFFTTKPVGAGSGLGLSQVYGFVQQSQGCVTLDSAPGAGTTVTLYLPRAAPAAAAAAIGTDSRQGQADGFGWQPAPA